MARALAELETLLHAQWGTGMLPHIVFSPEASYYASGPDWWRCAEVCPDAPHSPATSGILQPPVHAIALERILADARATGGADQAVARDFSTGTATAWCDRGVIVPSRSPTTTIAP